MPPIIALPTPKLAARSAVAAAVLLACACFVTLVTHSSQQTFETFNDPARYAAALRDSALGLRWIVAIDDCFIIAYALTTVCLVSVLMRRGLEAPLGLLLVSVLAGAALDFTENHQIVSLLRRAELGFVPTLEELTQREALSSLKWLLAHGAFAMLGLLLRFPAELAVPLRASFVGLQVVVGVAVLVVTSPSLLSALSWVRYGNILSGFLIIAWLMRTESDEQAQAEALGAAVHAQ